MTAVEIKLSVLQTGNKAQLSSKKTKHQSSANPKQKAILDVIDSVLTVLTDLWIESVSLETLTSVLSCLGGAVVGRLTRDRKVAGSTPGRGAIKSTRSPQRSIPLG